MCGICGILGTRDDFAVGEELVTAMRERLRHRGPDDGGSWYSPQQRVALGHRRLSIIDLSPAGHQPMSNEDGTVWVTFGGEIYNHEELRPEIKALLAHPAISPELDEEAFFHYLTFVCAPAPLTMFEGIRKLGPAERMTVRADGSTELETYWSPLSDRAVEEVVALSEPELE